MPNTVTIRTKIKDEANKGFGGLAAGLGQLVGGAIIPATAAAAALGVELIGAGAAAGVFGAAVAPQIASIKQVSTEQDAYNKAVAEYGKNSTQASTAQKKLKGDMDALAPATRDTATAFMGVKEAFSKWSNSLAGSTMPVFTHTLKGLTNIFPMLTPLVKSSAGQFNQLAVRFEAFTRTDRFKELVTEFSGFASGALKNVLHGIEAISKSLVHGFESQGFKDFIQMGKQQGPGIAKMFEHLAEFVGKFVKAAGPMAGLQLKVLEVLADALNAIPMDVLQVLAPALLGAAAGMKLLKTVMIGGEVIRGLALGFQMLAIQLGLSSTAMADFDAAADANPIGAVVLALTALVAGAIYAYNHFKTFRLIVQDTFDALKLAGAATLDFLLVVFKGLTDAWMGAVGGIIHGAALAFGWVPGLGGKLKAADAAFGRFAAAVDGKFDDMIGKSKDWESSAQKSMRERKLKMDISDYTNKIHSAKKQLSNKNLPESKKIAIRANIADLIAKRKAAQAEVNSLHGKTVTLYMRVVKSGSMAGFTNIGGIARRAGGQAAEGGMRGNQVLVGEGGPEIVNLPTGSYVHSNPDSQRIMGYASGGVSAGFRKALDFITMQARNNVSIDEDLSYAHHMPAFYEKYRHQIASGLFSSKGTGIYAPLLDALKRDTGKPKGGRTFWQAFAHDFTSTAAGKSASSGGAGGGGGAPGMINVTVNIGGKTIVSEIMDPLKREIRNRGGITIALGS